MGKIPIGDCFYQIRNGANIKQCEAAGGFPITRIETTANDKFNRDRMGYAGITDLSKYKSYVLEDGDLLMSHINSVQYLGRTVLYEKQGDEQIIHGMNLLGLKANRAIVIPSYARYCFYSPSFRKQLSKITKKSVNQASFTVSDLKRIVIEIPTLCEQEKVVGILNKASGIIEIRKNELQTLDNLIKARFVEMFGTIDSNVYNYPVVRLGDYAKLQGGYAFRSKDFIDDGIPLVQIGNVNTDYLNWEVMNSVPNDYLQKYKDFSLCEGDLVMAMTRPIIKSLNSVKVAKVRRSDVPCLLNQRVGRFILSTSLNSLFLEMLCKSDDFKNYVEKMSGNSLQPNISSRQVEDYMIILPPMTLQKKYAAFVSQVDKSKTEVQKSLDEAQLLFDSLMQQYFG